MHKLTTPEKDRKETREKAKRERRIERGMVGEKKEGWGFKGECVRKRHNKFK